jgi:hypothetical protein
LRQANLILCLCFFGFPYFVFNLFSQLPQSPSFILCFPSYLTSPSTSTLHRVKFVSNLPPVVCRRLTRSPLEETCSILWPDFISSPYSETLSLQKTLCTNLFECHGNLEPWLTPRFTKTGLH